MAEKFNGVEVKGRGFAENRRFDLFPKNGEKEKSEARVTLLYGRNGSGKTTLAAAFRAVDPTTADSQLEVSFVKEDGTTLPAADCDEAFKRSIAVFDEKYVDKKIRLKSDTKGLGTIVLFSDLIDIDGQIETIKKEKGKTESELTKLDQELLGYSDPKDVRSPEYHLARIIENMKNTWAEKVRDARKASRKPPVSEGFALETARMKCKTAKQDVAKEIAKCSADLESLARIGDVGDMPPVVQLSLDGFDETAFLQLLNRHVEKPVLSEREKRIMSLLEDAHGNRIDEIREVFHDPGTGYCPYCFRDITAAEKSDLVGSVEKVLNKEVEDYQNVLSMVVFPNFLFDYGRYRIIDPVIAEEVQKAVAECAEKVGRYREDVAAKSGNVYSVAAFQERGLTAAVAAANEKIRAMEAKRESASAMAKRKSAIEADLLRLYTEEAHYGMAKDYAAYEKQLAERSARDKKRDELDQLVSSLQNKIDGLESKKAGTDIAVECINDSLNYIFASKDRFQVKTKDGAYVLKSRGHDVLPADVSTGERHILALAYFFVDIMANHARKDFYKDERLLVIDDPVSSYDQENRIGVYSFLMRVMQKVLAGNKASRILLMTHDLYTVVGLMRAVGMLTDNCPGVPKFAVRCLEMRPGGLMDFRPNGRDEYGMLLNAVYQFAKDKATDASLTIGNEMRRVLEAYSSFLYQMDFANLFGPDFKSRLRDLGPYLMSRIDRLVLNDESHMRDRARSLAVDGSFFAAIADEEKQQTAQDVLCLLYLLDPLHVRRHFQVCGEQGVDAQAEKDIKAWIKEREDKLPKAKAV